MYPASSPWELYNDPEVDILFTNELPPGVVCKLLNMLDPIVLLSLRHIALEAEQILASLMLITFLLFDFSPRLGNLERIIFVGQPTCPEKEGDCAALFEPFKVLTISWAGGITSQGTHLYTENFVRRCREVNKQHFLDPR